MHAWHEPCDPLHPESKRNAARLTANPKSQSSNELQDHDRPDQPPTLLQSSTIDKCFLAWTLIPSPATLEGYELILCRLNIVQADSTHLKLIARMAAFVTAVQASAPVVQIGRNSCQLERNSRTRVGKSRNRTGKVQPTGTEPNKSPLFHIDIPPKEKNTGPSVAQWAKGLRKEAIYK